MRFCKKHTIKRASRFARQLFVFYISVFLRCIVYPPPFFLFVFSLLSSIKKVKSQRQSINLTLHLIAQRRGHTTPLPPDHHPLFFSVTPCRRDAKLYSRHSRRRYFNHRKTSSKIRTAAPPSQMSHLRPRNNQSQWCATRGRVMPNCSQQNHN